MGKNLPDLPSVRFGTDEPKMSVPLPPLADDQDDDELPTEPTDQLTLSILGFDPKDPAEWPEIVRYRP